MPSPDFDNSPIIGGLLSNPAGRWPDSIGHIAFFKDYPYFLPCAVAGLVSLLCFLLTLFGLEEVSCPSFTESFILRSLNQTLPSMADEKQSTDIETSHTHPSAEIDTIVAATMATTLIDDHGMQKPSYGATDQLRSALSTTGSSPEVSPPTSSRSPPGFRDLLIPSIITLNINYAILCFLEQCIQVLIPLMYSTSISLGGLGFSPYMIGLIMSVWGICNGMIQVAAFASIRKLVGHRNLYVLGLSSYIVSLAAFPLMNILARREGRVDAWVWTVLVVQLGVCPLSYMSFGEDNVYVISRFIRLKPKGKAACSYILAGSHPVETPWDQQMAWPR